MEANQASFEEKVLARSQEVPVVVDFWAPWCGPCKFLGPVIEELANEAAGRWELVKVNTDENPELSQKFRIKGIPAVKMFYQGEVVGEFTGALPKTQIQRWLDENIPDPRQETLAQIKERLQGEAYAQALKDLEAFVEENPDLDEAKICLASEKIYENLVQAASLLEGIKLDGKLIDSIEDTRNLIQFLQTETDSTHNLAKKVQSAQATLKERNFEATLQQLIEVVMVDKSFAEELPRKAIIAIFHRLGDQHELTQKYRKRFDMALY